MISRKESSISHHLSVVGKSSSVIVLETFKETELVEMAVARTATNCCVFVTKYVDKVLTLQIIAVAAKN